MEKTSEMLMAVKALEDEVKGIEDYSKMIEYTEDRGLASIFTNAMNAEKEHAKALLNWLINKSQHILK